MHALLNGFDKDYDLVGGHIDRSVGHATYEKRLEKYNSDASEVLMFAISLVHNQNKCFTGEGSGERCFNDNYNSSK